MNLELHTSNSRRSTRNVATSSLQMRTTLSRWVTAICFGMVLMPRVFSADLVHDKIEFNRDTRPLLSDRCFACHGPDPASRKGNLRLDVEATAKADRGGYAAIV